MTSRFIKKVLPILFAGLFFAACTIYQSLWSPAYVTHYFTDLKEITLEVSTGDPCLHIYLMTESSCGIHSRGEDKELYDELCRKHHDTAYNQRVSLIDGTIVESPAYSGIDFLSVDVCTDKDFDALHPAGSSLSDIVRFFSLSPYRYILNGYSTDYGFDFDALSDSGQKGMEAHKRRKGTGHDELCPIDKLVKDLEPGDLTLLGEGSFYPIWVGSLYFETQPDTPGEYTITLTMRTDTDEVFSANAVVTW